MLKFLSSTIGIIFLIGLLTRLQLPPGSWTVRRSAQGNALPAPALP